MPRLIPLCIAIVLTIAGCARSADVPRLEPWEYAETRDGLARETLARDGTRDVWMRATLPRERYTHLIFRAYVGELTLYVEQQRVYHFRDPHAHQRLAFHVVPLPRDAAGRRVFLHIPRAPATPLLGSAPYLVAEGTIPRALELAASQPLREDASDVFIAFVLMFTGAVSLGASVVRRRGDVLPMRWFGLFTLLYGARLLAESYALLFLGASIVTSAYVESFITYVIPIPGWALARRLVGGGWRRSLDLQVLVFAIFAPIGIASDLVTRDPGSLELVNNVLVIAGGVNILLNLMASRARRTPELRVVFAGAVVFMLFALSNNLTALGLLPWTQFDETFGFLAFVATLGYAAAQGFTRGERERMSLEHELETAREIQQSILPTRMPDVAGLRFEARFDPASSVAGDLYDVVRIDDAHAGVLVADVAGHGVPAALIASMVKIAVSSQAHLARDPAALLTALNITLRREVRRAFVTATYLWFDMEQRRVVVCNAGHAPPLLFRDGAFLELGPHGVLLGRFANARYESAATELREGDRIVAFTDGILEARNSRGEQFGEERLRAMIAEGANCDAIVAAVHRWRGRDDEADDLTIVSVVLERR